MDNIKAVLFDLDGTLLDTAPDLAAALNIQLSMHDRKDILFAEIRPIASHGSKALVKLGFNIDETHESFAALREEYLHIYSEHSCNLTDLFPGMSAVLLALNNKQIPWGIVTNKPTWLTLPILNKLSLLNKAACVVCGDTVNKSKPHPEPLLYACELLQCSPSETLYIGDAEFDVLAGKQAGIKTILANYGYITDKAAAAKWGADGFINSPIEVLDFLR